MSLPFHADYLPAVRYVGLETAQLTALMSSLVAQRRELEERICCIERSSFLASADLFTEDRERIVCAQRLRVMDFLVRKLVWRLLEAQQHDQRDTRLAYRAVDHELGHPTEETLEVADSLVEACTREWLGLRDPLPQLRSLFLECRRYMEEAFEDAPCLTRRS